MCEFILNCIRCCGFSLAPFYLNPFNPILMLYCHLVVYSKHYNCNHAVKQLFHWLVYLLIRLSIFPLKFVPKLHFFDLIEGRKTKKDEIIQKQGKNKWEKSLLFQCKWKHTFIIVQFTYITQSMWTHRPHLTLHFKPVWIKMTINSHNRILITINIV